MLRRAWLDASTTASACSITFSHRAKRRRACGLTRSGDDADRAGRPATRRQPAPTARAARASPRRLATRRCLIACLQRWTPRRTVGAPAEGSKRATIVRAGGRLADAVEHELHGQPGEQDAETRLTTSASVRPSTAISCSAARIAPKVRKRQANIIAMTLAASIRPAVRPITSTAAREAARSRDQRKGRGNNVPGLLRRSSRAGAA